MITTTTEEPATTTTEAPITITIPEYTTQEPPVTDTPVHENCVAGITYFPSLTDCTRYYQCNSLNQAVQVQCPIGLEFNPNTLLCDWPGFCFITTTEIPTTTTETPTTTTTTTEAPTTQPPTTTETPVVTEAPIPNEKCTEGVTYFPSSTDCTQYYQCNSAGEAIQVTCPAGLEFNPTTLQCDWPADFCTIDGGGEIDLPTCPEIEDIENPVHLPHSSDCELYYICLSGIPHELSCPPGQHWSVENNWCDFPDLANCQV